MRAQNIYTIEALAAIDGLELKNLGMNGRDLKNKAQEYLEEARNGAPTPDAVRTGSVARQERAAGGGPPRHQGRRAGLTPTREDRFDGMNLDELREFVTTNTGQAPLGSMSAEETLIRLARDATGDWTTKAA